MQKEFPPTIRLHLKKGHEAREFQFFATELGTCAFANIYKNIRKKVFTVKHSTEDALSYRFLLGIRVPPARDKRSICVCCQRLLQGWYSMVERMSQIKKRPQLIKCARFLSRPLDLSVRYWFFAPRTYFQEKSDNYSLRVKKQLLNYWLFFKSFFNVNIKSELLYHNFYLL